MDDIVVSLLVFTGLLGAIGLWVVIVYNRFIRLRNRADALWANIDVQLRRRHDLVPNLVNVVEAYATHERGTLDEVTQARSAAMSAQSTGEQAHAETVLSSALGRLFAVVEDYPELQAEERFQDLHEELTRLEDVIAMARGAYNTTVQAYNNAVQTIPTNFVASFAGFEARDYLSADASDRLVPDAAIDIPPVPSTR